METLARTRRVGGSLMVTLPKELAEEEGIGEDQMIVITFAKVRKSGFGMCKGLGKFTKEDKFMGQLE